MNARSGYSVFEVLVAFTVMSLVLAVLVPGQTQLLRRAQNGPEKLLAQDLAYSRIATLGVSRSIEEGVSQTQDGPWTIEEVVTKRDSRFLIIVRVSSGRGLLYETEALR